jgi:hypothetical protein
MTDAGIHRERPHPPTRTPDCDRPRAALPITIQFTAETPSPVHPGAPDGASQLQQRIHSRIVGSDLPMPLHDRSGGL